MPREYCSSCAAEVPVDDGICFFGHEVAGDDAAPVDDTPELVGSETSDFAAQSHESAADEPDAGLTSAAPAAINASESGQSENVGVWAGDDGDEIVGSDDDLSELAAYQIVEPDDDEDDEVDEPTTETSSPEIIEPEDDDFYDDDDPSEFAAYQVIEPEDDEDDEPTTETSSPEIIEPGDDEELDARVEIDVGGDDDVDVAALEAAIAELEGQSNDDLLTDAEDDIVVREPEVESSPSAWESAEDEDETSDLVGSSDWSASDGFDHDVVAEWDLESDDASDAPTEPSGPPLAEQALAEGGLSAHRARGESDIDDLLDQGDLEGGLTWEQDVVIDETPADGSDRSDAASTDSVAGDGAEAEDQETTDDVDDGSIWGEAFGDDAAESSDAPATHDEWDLGEFEESTEERTYEPEAAEPVPAEEPQEPEEPAYEGDPTIDTSSFTAHGKGKKKGFLSRLFG